MLAPTTPDELADALRTLAAARQRILLGGNFSKDRLGGVAAPGEVVSTSRMTRLLAYDPRDLTISVEAGMPFAELQRTLAEHRQMLPLDPAWLQQGTVGGVVGANLSGALRRQYGTARDMIIGMTFATLEGKLVSSGGMVVKNVAGLDMAKLMVGSFGTLAAIATVNFKVFPMPPEWRTFVWRFATTGEAFAKRDAILESVLQPAAIDIDNVLGAVRLMVRVGGSAAVVARWSREHPDAEVVDCIVWDELREFPARFLAEHAGGAVVSRHGTHEEIARIAAELDTPFIARAGSGVVYSFHETNPPMQELGAGFEMMEKVKRMFDPEHLLNRGRLHGRI